MIALMTSPVRPVQSTAGASRPIVALYLAHLLVPLVLLIDSLRAVLAYESGTTEKYVIAIASLWLVIGFAGWRIHAAVWHVCGYSCSTGTHVTRRHQKCDVCATRRRGHDIVFHVAGDDDIHSQCCRHPERDQLLDTRSKMIQGLTASPRAPASALRRASKVKKSFEPSFFRQRHVQHIETAAAASGRVGGRPVWRQPGVARPAHF